MTQMSANKKIGAAGNLNWRTNNTLLQRFNVNSLNELTTVTNNGKLTVAGTTTSPATNVTVNTSNALVYADTTFASTNETLYIIRHADAHPRAYWSDNNYVGAGQWRALDLPNALPGKISPNQVYSNRPRSI